MVFCASSLAPVMEQIVEEWDKIHEERIILNVASSGALARQIRHGAEADIFLSANRQWVDYLLKETNIGSSPSMIAGNHLVIIVPAGSPADSLDFYDILPSLPGENNLIAIGDPGHVPLGIYTKEAFTSLNIWEKVKNHIITAKDARSTLRLVEWGEAAWGIVYATDAMHSKNVKIVAEIPTKLNSPIEYDGLLINEHNPVAKQFLAFISSSEVKKIWKSMGFDHLIGIHDHRHD